MQFLASERFMEKFEKARALLSNKNGAMSYEAVLEAALDELLKDHDPEERNKRREHRREKAEAGTKSKNCAANGAAGPRAKGGIRRAGIGSAKGPSRSSVQAGSGQADDPLFRRWIGGLPATRIPANDEESSRRIPAATRDAVFERNKGRCTYVGSNGERCGATHNLEIDHIVPHARGGSNALDNLRLLCERHNKLEAERVLGANAIRQFRPRE